MLWSLVYLITKKTMWQNKNKIQTNQKTTVSLPKLEYIPTDKRMWNSIKRRVKISDKIFDLKDFALIYVWAVVWWWVSYFSVEDKIKGEYKKRLIILSVVALLVLIILLWMKYQKKEFNNTILTDMEETESCL